MDDTLNYSRLCLADIKRHTEGLSYSDTCQYFIQLLTNVSPKRVLENMLISSLRLHGLLREGGWPLWPLVTSSLSGGHSVWPIFSLLNPEVNFG